MPHPVCRVRDEPTREANHKKPLESPTKTKLFPTFLFVCFVLYFFKAKKKMVALSITPVAAAERLLQRGRDPPSSTVHSSTGRAS